MCPRSSYPCSTEGHRPLELFRRAIGGGPVHTGARNLATATSTTSSSSGYDPFVPGPRRLARRRYADTSPPHLRPPVRFPASRAARFSWFGSGPSYLTFYSFREEVPANHRGPRQHPVTAQSAPRHRQISSVVSSHATSAPARRGFFHFYFYLAVLQKHP